MNYDTDFEPTKDTWLYEQIDKLFAKLHKQNLRIDELESAISRLDNDLNYAIRDIDNLKRELCKY